MERYFNKSINFISILLKFSILSITLSIVLALVTSDFNEFSFTISYFSIILSVYIILFSLLILSVIFAHHFFKKIKIQNSLKKDFLILTIAIISLSILGVVNYFKFN